VTRPRDLGILVGDVPVGPYNAITDVPGVHIGHSTLRHGSDIRTGITAVVPVDVSPRQPVPAALAVGNGYGKLIGATQLQELGELETPILLTATLSAFRVADALVGWMLQRHPDLRTVNPVVAETNDGYLSDIRARPLGEEHVSAALDGAAGGAVPQGCVGAGTGVGALGFKGGIGTSSRVVPGAGTVGVLVQPNFGGTLRVLGVPVRPADVGVGVGSGARPAGSGVIVVATDAPLDARQLGRVARRAVYALGRVGASYAPGSGDYAIAVSTDRLARRLRDDGLGPLFAATMDAVEESVLAGLLAAETTSGVDGHVLPALPADRLAEVLRARGVG
jgi:D-aminopeptidase